MTQNESGSNLCMAAPAPPPGATTMPQDEPAAPIADQTTDPELADVPNHTIDTTADVQPEIEPGAPYGEPAPDAPAPLDAHADLSDVELPVEHDPNPQATVNAQPVDEPINVEDVNTTRVKTEVLGPTPGVPAGSDSPADPARDIAPADAADAPTSE